ncbi:MAG: IreB family regulatory phosphoprotein [Clostridiales bacterium]|nr:IreB family regulatory phosphoprotein [Clostridiales bacterium]
MANYDNDATLTFSLKDEHEQEMRTILYTVYTALTEKGYNPVDQIVGYILSEDPTYITNHKNARALIRKIDREELLTSLVRNYLKL